MRSSILILLALAFTLLAPLGGVQAQSAPAVQELQSSLAPGQSDLFHLKGLRQGQVLGAIMENTSGNLDPILAILPADDLSATLESFQKAVADLVAGSAYPLLDLPALRDKYTLAWDDDGGPGYSAALQFTVPKDGDYFLLAGSSLSAAGRQTGGTYRLLVGLDAPQVLAGTAVPTGAVIAVPDQAILGTQLIQQLSSSLDQNKPSISVKLSDLNPGDTLYVDLEAISGDLKPILALRDYGNKPVLVANLNGQASRVSFEQAFPEGGASYSLDIQAASPNGQLTSGDFRLLVGVSAPEVLEGQGQPNTESVLKLPIPVKVGLKLQQIVNIDQPNEVILNEYTPKAVSYHVGS